MSGLAARAIPGVGLTVFQVEDRKSYIGGTDAKRIMDGDWLNLWLEKTGRAEPEDLSDVLPVQLGSFTEPFNRIWFERQTGRKVTRVAEHAVHPTIPYMAANLDGVTVTARLRPELCYWDAKHVGKLDDRVIERYTPQMTHNALVIGADWWCLSVLIGNKSWETVEQEVDPFYAEALLQREREFWSYVTADTEPPTLAKSPAPKPVKLRVVSLEDADKAGWPNWGGEMVERLGDYGAVLSAWTRGNIVREEIKKLLPDDVGLVTRGLWKITRNKAGAVTVGRTKEAGDAGK